MRASQNHLPQSFEASHRPQQPQYFLVVMSGRRNSYVELDSAKKLKILAPQCTRCASLTNNVVNLESLCAINTGKTFELSFSPSAFVRRVWILKILNLSVLDGEETLVRRNENQKRILDRGWNISREQTQNNFNCMQNLHQAAKSNFPC